MTLTFHQRRIVNLLLDGFSQKEIPAKLGISPRTLKQHLNRIYERNGIFSGHKQVILAVMAHGEKVADAR